MGLLGRRGSATAVLLLMLTACLTASGLLATSATAKPDTVHIVGKMRTDGVLTVHQLETVTLKGMPPRLNLNVVIAPPDDLNSCYDILPGTCFPTPLYPAPSTVPFRTSGKGRATLTFVMPDSYRFKPGTSLPEFQTDHRPFWNGQVIYLRARGVGNQRRKGIRTIVRGKATGRAVVEVPPAS
jgi:hypothetical protein